MTRMSTPSPYFWGTYGIIYNPEIITDIEFTSWNDLWNPSLRNEILLIDSAREVIGLGLNSLCYSLNETDISRLRGSETEARQAHS